MTHPAALLARDPAGVPVLDPPSSVRGERGDVPGWVLITLMTAASWPSSGASPRTSSRTLFTDALDRARR